MHIAKSTLFGGLLCGALALPLFVPADSAAVDTDTFGFGKRVRAGDVIKEYPFLALNAPPTAERRKLLEPATLLDETKLRLEAFEFRFDQHYRHPSLWAGHRGDLTLGGRPEKEWTEGERAVMRMVTLQTLHQHDVNQFINSEGFGFTRLGPFPKLRYLDLPEARPVPFAKSTVESLSAEVGAEVDLPMTPREPERAAPRMPSRVRLADFHTDGTLNFLNPAGFGYRKLDESGRRVSGFQSHQFRRMPQLADEPAKASSERWLVRRLELVSLLMHDEPVVYVSDHLPNMKSAKKAETRPLDEIEADALRKLRAGDDLVTAATANRIRMLGSLRASKECMSCHDVERGQLLGAFAYDLRRDPPIE